MIRSEAIPADAFPRELLPGVGDHAQIRCLSERSGRSVHLVDDGSGSLRVFKIHRLPSEKDLERFERVRSRLSGGPPCPRLLPVLDHGAAPCLGIAWEELALADSSDPGHRTLQDYSPETLRDHEMIGRAPSRAVAAIGLDLLGAMEHLGGVGLVHGDIKPSNIFRLRGAWVLGDLDSVAPAIESTVPSNLSTEGYRPPGGGSGAECDAYALGKVLYEVWTGNDRLEFPNLPVRLLSERRWTPGDRLLNDLINALCSPLGLHRLTRLEGIRAALEALASGSDADQVRAARGLGRHGARFVGRRGMILVSVAVLVAAGLGLSGVWSRPLEFSVASVTWQGQSLLALPYRHPQGNNEGYVRAGDLVDSPSLMLFNAHLLRKRPLETGDRVVMELQKEVWRGHVAAYLSPHPLIDEPEARFCHRDQFGRLPFRMFFHLDGDELVAPTGADHGVPVTLPPESWRPRFITNSLQTYRVSLDIGAREIGWSVHSDDRLLVEGTMPKPFASCYLGLYAFDNTLCYVKRLRVDRSASHPR